MSPLLKRATRFALALSVAAAAGCNLDTGSPSNPSTLLASASTNQSIKTGATADIGVFVLNSFGEPLKGIPINFAISSGTGTLSSGTVASDANGRALVTFTPTKAGASQITAAVGTIKLTFVITAADG